MRFFDHLNSGPERFDESNVRWRGLGIGYADEIQAVLLAQHRHGDAEISRTGLDDGRTARDDLTPSNCPFDHGLCCSILDASARIELLELAVHLEGEAVEQMVHSYERGVTDQIGDGCRGCATCFGMCLNCGRHVAPWSVAAGIRGRSGGSGCRAAMRIEARAVLRTSSRDCLDSLGRRAAVIA